MYKRMNLFLEKDMNELPYVLADSMLDIACHLKSSQVKEMFYSLCQHELYLQFIVNCFVMGICHLLFNVCASKTGPFVP